MPDPRYAPTTYGQAQADPPESGRRAAGARASAAPVGRASASAGRAPAGRAPVPGAGDGGGRGPTRRGNGRKRRRDPLWARLLIIFGAVLMMASGGSLVGEKILISKVSSSITQTSLLGGPKISIKGAVNILLMGIDRRQVNDPTRSDSIIIVHIPATHDKAYLISVPRDSRVHIPPFPLTHYAGGVDRINAAFFYGSINGGGLNNGFKLLAETITSFTGIQFNAGAIVDFQGFQALVGALGGVTMYVDEKTTSIHIGVNAQGKEETPFTQDANLQLHPVPGVTPEVYNVGWHHFAPWQALDYVRQRDLLANGDGDYGRQRHQQQFIKAVFEEALTKGLENPLKIDSIISAAGKALTVDLGGVSVATWVDSMSSVRSMTMIKTNGGNYDSLYVNGQYVGEGLTSDTLQLFSDVRTDDVASFLATHPSWVASSS